MLKKLLIITVFQRELLTNFISIFTKTFLKELIIMKNYCVYLVFISFLLCFYSCSSEKITNDTQQENLKVFKLNEAFGITSLDPAFARSFENIMAVNQLYNGLVQMNEKLEVIPAIAKSWEISDDGKVYTFHLRDDVYFHDHPVFPNGKGRKVVAQDFVNSFYRIIDPKLASPGAWIFNDVDFSEKSDYSGFVAVDDTTLKIFLKNPFPPFLGILTMQYCSVVPHEIVEKYGEDFRSNPVGTGPFKFKTWKEGVKLVFVKNENYFEKDENGNKLPYLDAVSISFIKDRHSEFLSFIRGEFDLLSGLDGSYKDELLTQQGELKDKYKDKIVLRKVPFLKTDYIAFYLDERNEAVKKSPLRLKQIRQAINYGFNREEMVRYLRNNIGQPAHAGFIPMGMPGFDPAKVVGYRYNPDKARDLLYQAGFPEGKGLPEITLSTTSAYLDLCEYIQKQLNEIGIKIKIDVLPAAIHSESAARGKLQFFRKSWVADYPDAENYLALFYSKNFAPAGPNYTHFNNQLYDKLYESAKQTLDFNKRIELYQEMDRIIVEEAPVVNLYYDEAIKFHHKNIEGLEINPMNLFTLKRVKKN
jgi:peptide/nickel transport system substrate-binding protein